MTSSQPTSMAIDEAQAGFQFEPGADGSGAELFKLASTAAVRSFLDQHSFLVHLLLEIRGKLHHYFLDSPVSLEIAVDPDEPQRQQIVVGITTSLSPCEAVDKLGQFDREWWLDNLGRAQGKICVDVQFT